METKKSWRQFIGKERDFRKYYGRPYYTKAERKLARKANKRAAVKEVDETFYSEVA